MKNYAQVSGILSIVSGVFGILSMVLLIFFVMMFQSSVAIDDPSLGMYEDQMFMWVLDIYIAMAVLCGLGGLFSIIGGVYAIKRRYWGLGLAAAIVATIIFMPCGIPAIIFIAMGKQEFAPREVLADPLA